MNSRHASCESESMVMYVWPSLRSRLLIANAMAKHSALVIDVVYSDALDAMLLVSLLTIVTT